MAFAGQLSSGWLVATAAAVGTFYLLWRIVKHRRYNEILVGILFIPFFYYVANLFAGNGVIFVPNLFPFKFHNIRYGLTYFPFLVLAASVVLSRKLVVSALAILLVVGEYSFFIQHGNIVTLNESLVGFAGRITYMDQLNEARWLREHYTGG